MVIECFIAMMYMWKMPLTGSYTDKPNARLPYSKIDEYGIVMHGLPDGKSLKHPSSYGKNYLLKVLKEKNNLRMTGMPSGYYSSTAV